MQRITQYVEEEKIYLNVDCKLSDLSLALDEKERQISNCIKEYQNCSFAQYINRYRIDFAQQLLLSNPDKKIAEIWTYSGFATEQSFFRAFKSVTGMTPSEWRERQH